MSLCFGCCCGTSIFWDVVCACDVGVAALDELLRQPLRLSFRLREVAEEGVSGSVDVVCVDDDASCFGRARGPFTLMFCISVSVSLSLYSPLGREYKRANSPPPFGNEFDAKGVVVACRPGWSVGIGIVDGWSELSACRRLYAELLLLRCLPESKCSELLLLEKKLAFDAVIGVLGVLLPRFGGGVVTLRPSPSADGIGNDDILLLNGVPRGNRFRGGSRSGWRFFLLLTGITGVFSTSPDPTVSPLLCLMLRLPLDESELGVPGVSAFLRSSPEPSRAWNFVSSNMLVSIRVCEGG
jgi:hypothetical protein